MAYIKYIGLIEPIYNIFAKVIFQEMLRLKDTKYKINVVIHCDMSLHKITLHTIKLFQL